MEIFKDIKGYEGMYQVSNLGRVKSLARTRIGKSNCTCKLQERILKQSINQGYSYVGLSKKGILKVKKVHRLVAIAFISNPENKLEVNHKDLNKINNNLYNLEWNTRKENNDHAIRNGVKFCITNIESLYAGNESWLITTTRELDYYIRNLL